MGVDVIRLPADDAGKRLKARTELMSGNTVYKEIVVVDYESGLVVLNSGQTLVLEAGTEVGISGSVEIISPDSLSGLRIILPGIQVSGAVVVSGNVQIIDQNGNELELVKEADNYNAANHGIVMYGRDDGAPNKYRQLLVESDGHLVVHVMSSDLTVGIYEPVEVARLSGKVSILKVDSVGKIYVNSGQFIKIVEQILSGQVEIVNTVDVTETSPITGIRVSGAVIVSGNVSILGTVTVDGEVAISGSVTVLNPTTEVGISGDVTILTASRDNLSGLRVVAETTGGGQTSGTVGVSGEVLTGIYEPVAVDRLSGQTSLVRINEQGEVIVQSTPAGGGQTSGTVQVSGDVLVGIYEPVDVNRASGQVSLLKVGQTGKLEIDITPTGGGQASGAVQVSGTVGVSGEVLTGIYEPVDVNRLSGQASLIKVDEQGRLLTTGAGGGQVSGAVIVSGNVNVPTVTIVDEVASGLVEILGTVAVQEQSSVTAVRVSGTVEVSGDVNVAIYEPVVVTRLSGQVSLLTVDDEGKLIVNVTSGRVEILGTVNVSEQSPITG
ncbi:MAG: hypothetical protein ACXABY_12660, partial [Candidatus Thorarchaeota archaeon]